MNAIDPGQLREPRVHEDIERVLVPSSAIAERVRALAATIGGDYEHADGRLTVVPVMTGSLLFAADLVRALPQRRMRIQLTTVSSYGGTATASRGSSTVTACSCPTYRISAARLNSMPSGVTLHPAIAAWPSSSIAA